MPNKYVDIKITGWERLHFRDDADMQKVIESIKKDGLECIYEEELGYSTVESLAETNDYMTVEENDGEPTIEVYDGSVNEIWNNSKK